MFDLRFCRFHLSEVNLYEIFLPVTEGLFLQFNSAELVR